MPPHRGKLALFFNVAGSVPFNLRFPELRVCLWQDEIPAIIMPTPEASVHENACAVFAHNDIGMTRQAWVVQPISETSAEQKLPHHNLRSGVLSSY